MAYVAPTTANVTAGAAILASDMLTVMNDIIDHETYVAGIRTGWTSWTPTYIALAGGTTNTAKYMQIGKFVVCEWKYTLSSAGVSGGVGISVPVAAASSVPVNMAVGSSQCIQSGVDTTMGIVFYQSGVIYVQYMVADSGAGYMLKSRSTSATLPFTWKSGDALQAQWVYEAA